MKFRTLRHLFYYSFILSIASVDGSAQSKELSIEQDPKFEKLLNEKRKINGLITVNERYKIQVYSGDNDRAKNTLNNCKQEFGDLDVTIVFNTPNYKVYVGNFRTRMAAERNLLVVRKKYENAYLIKPQK
jgi:hypothetical protein